MTIKQFTVRNYGAVKLFETGVSDELSILDTPFPKEISSALELLMCNKTRCFSVRKSTLICAQVSIDGNTYFVKLAPEGKECALSMTVTDFQGNDATRFYKCTLEHCAEQDACEIFDGSNSSFLRRLSEYHACDERGASYDLIKRTDYIAKTRSFHTYLRKYIKDYKSEMVGAGLLTAMDERGNFEMIGGGAPSKNKKWLFEYICYLNVVRFWEKVEAIRDMHHEKKPLVVRNLLEFLGKTEDAKTVFSKTKDLKRQAIILTKT